MKPGPDERRQLTSSGKATSGLQANDAPAKSGLRAAEEGSARPPSGFYGTVNEAAADPGKWWNSLTRWLETSDDTDPAKYLTWCCDDFRPRRLKAPVVLAWLLVQSFGLLFQAVLLSEVSRNLEDYEATLASNCAPQHFAHDVCLGPAWNLSFSGPMNFPPSESQADFDYVIPKTQPFLFKTLSQPPTFMLGVEPLAPHENAEWQISLGPGKESDSLWWSSRRTLNLGPAAQGWGSRYHVVTSKEYKGPSWSGALNLKSKYSETAAINVFVVDSRITHLEDVHKQEQCSFEKSWENFSSRSQGRHHKVLSYARSATLFFLIVQLMLAGVVFRRFFLYVETSKLLSRVIALKFVVQDFPQQMCIVAYLYAWYADNGMRCQMCLFHPEHCDYQYPLHATNLMVCLFTLLSAMANQLLLQAKLKRGYDSEDECVMGFFRFILMSVSVLPFTT
eukprot:CAMPEP_0197637642 /NCGR_PEP_ID=MMETSP1338-20131121/12803_1 /TAXON_ID=43686 ORGANISM="Pelagodinium beii, Strain RCC1491" /NCGR_SAMPLE_ID=MMETSP1338 /ASSEMBLY_ACC=CAM_ASM_000754 /LENGTH=448 /DNA_ID=CAMNT_0043210081 /DNA_START=16 /DNA_END=1358 /DNA_ORIENTATION=-